MILPFIMLYNSNNNKKHKSALEYQHILIFAQVNAANGHFYMHIIFNRLKFYIYLYLTLLLIMAIRLMHFLDAYVTRIYNPILINAVILLST